MKSFIFVVVLTVFMVQSEIVDKKDAYNEMVNALNEYKSTGKRPINLKAAVESYNVIKKSSTSDEEPEEKCKTCALIADLIIHQRQVVGMNDTDLAKEVLFFCNLYSGDTQRVCEGFTEFNTPVYLYILDHAVNLTGVEVCSIVMQNYGCPMPEKYNWSVDVPAGNTVAKVQSKGTKSFNILHITDIHYDPRYTTNKTNDCGEPVCCQDDQADGTSSGNSCGYWSDYINADIPWRTVINALEQTQNHDFDYVYFTGDIISHRTWNTSILDNIQIIAQILDALDQHYKVPVYPILGNHEAHPANLFSDVKDPTFSNEWLYEVMLQKLSKWVPINEVKETVLKGGYYTVSPKPGFRIVVLNNNICIIDNWWLVYNPKDPYDQLKWLTEVLLKAEQNNERVHLLHHIPSGRDDCYKIWSREYNRIINRFANTIAAQFNGHTHRDEFYVYYNESNGAQAINMAWNGASVVTYDKANPSYKILSVDAENFDLLDFEEWTYNLTKANQNGGENPDWYKLYSFKDAYGVKSLEAEEVSKLVFQMTKKHNLIDQYYRYKFRNGDVALKEGCDDDCKKDLLCTMVTTQNGDDSMCNEVKRLYDSYEVTYEVNVV